MKRTLFLVCAVTLGLALPGGATGVAPRPPVILDGVPPAATLVQTQNGGLDSFFREKDGSVWRAAFSNDGYQLAKPSLFAGADQMSRDMLPRLMTRDGRLHAYAMVHRGKMGKPTLDRFLDVWYSRGSANQGWRNPRMIFKGYVGAIMDFKQIASGRLVLPFAYWKDRAESEPPFGSNSTTTIWSDDGGNTWSAPQAALDAPCFEGFNGNNYGACEPTILELRDGRVWMLMRTQTGFLYQALSSDGAAWSAAVPSRFYSSTSPPALDRLRDGRLVLVWNNCEMPPRVDGAGVYGGRDALHAAISDDEGRTWRGFREIYRDQTRNQTPPRRGDRGTAYPIAYHSGSGNIVVRSGQGEGRRKVIVVDPAWLTQTEVFDDFSQGGQSWSVFKAFGPAEGWWRDRKQGPELVPHPQKAGATVLHLRRPDQDSPDGAVWNFPLGRTGRVTLRVLLEEGFGGARVLLTDRFLDPCDPRAHELAVFHVPVTPRGEIGSGRVAMNKWQTLELAFGLSQGECLVSLDGVPVGQVPAQWASLNGLCYLHLQSTAERPGDAGMLLESVSAKIKDPIAPRVDAAAVRAAAEAYQKQVYGRAVRVEPNQEDEADFF